MVAIAMTREMGTLGKDVAQGIANSLGLKIIHSELVEHDLATRLGVEESAVHRYLEGGASVLDRWKIDKEKLSRYTAEELLEFARDGNVIIRGLGCGCGPASRAARAAGARVCSYALPRAGDYGAVRTQGCERGPQ